MPTIKTESVRRFIDLYGIGCELPDGYEDEDDEEGDQD